MRHINALLNPTQSRNLQKALDLAIWEVAGNKNKDKHLFTVEDIEELKDKAMRWEIIVSSFKPEPELFPVRQTLKDARARQAEQRQGQL